MLGDITAADEIYIVTGRTDMRKSIDGLCAIVEDQLHMDPRRSALYLFCGKRCDRIKALLWESDGFVLLYKRMEVQGRFRWPRNQLEVKQLTWQQFDWISSVCVEIVLFSWLIMSLYARIFESFELPAICFLLLFHCSYYTIKSNEKEAENPAFTRDFRHDTG